MRHFFKGRWFSQLVLAVIFLGVAVVAYIGLVQIEQGKAQALKAGLPEAVSLRDYQGWSDLHPADEVHIVAKTVMALNYRLEMTRKRKLSSSVEERMVFFLFGPEDSAGSKTVRAALLLDSADVDRWGVEEFEPGLVTITDTEAVLRLNGQAVTNPSLKSLAEDALIERGLTKAPEFFFMESWGPGGRAAALAPDPNSAPMIGGGIAAVGLIFLLVAIRRFMGRHRLVEQQERLAQEVELARAAMIAQYKAQGLAVPEALTLPLKPRRSRSKMVLSVLVALIAGSVGLAYAGVLDDALFALPLLAVLLIMLGVRAVAKKIGGGLARIGGAVAQKAVPDRAEPPPAPRYGPKFAPMAQAAPLPESPLLVSDNITPAQPVITTVPSVSARLSAALSAPALIKWAPFGIGVIVMVVSSKLFGTMGLSGNMGGRIATGPAVAASPVAGDADPLLPFGLADLLGGSMMGMVGVTLLVVGAMAVLGFGLNLMVSRFAARRNIDYPNDPWARLDRMTAAERARG